MQSAALRQRPSLLAWRGASWQGSGSATGDNGNLREGNAVVLRRKLAGHWSQPIAAYHVSTDHVTHE